MLVLALTALRTAALQGLCAACASAFPDPACAALATACNAATSRTLQTTRGEGLFVSPSVGGKPYVRLRVYQYVGRNMPNTCRPSHLEKAMFRVWFKTFVLPIYAAFVATSDPRQLQSLCTICNYCAQYAERSTFGSKISTGWAASLRT